MSRAVRLVGFPGGSVRPRAAGVALGLAIAVAGCDKAPPPAPAAAPLASAANSTPAGRSFAVAGRAAKLAYSHDLELDMPAAGVKPRYERAVERCLDDAAFNCVVLRSSFGTGEQFGQGRPSATLTVRLPHDAVAPFEDALLAPVPGEAPGAAVLRSRSTVADDLTGAIEDVTRRQGQLADYRDRLSELAKRPDVKVEDLIKIESELSSTQSQLEELAAQLKALGRRVDTESLTVSFAARDAAGNLTAPILQAWRQASRILGDSTAVALRCVVAALPWLPLVAIALLLLRLVLRRWRRY
jgi:hypothetical protein